MENHSHVTAYCVLQQKHVVVQDPELDRVGNGGGMHRTVGYKTKGGKVVLYHGFCRGVKLWIWWYAKLRQWGMVEDINNAFDEESIRDVIALGPSDLHKGKAILGVTSSSSNVLGKRKARRNDDDDDDDEELAQALEQVVNATTTGRKTADVLADLKLRDNNAPSDIYRSLIDLALVHYKAPGPALIFDVYAVDAGNARTLYEADRTLCAELTTLALKRNQNLDQDPIQITFRDKRLSCRIADVHEFRRIHYEARSLFTAPTALQKTAPVAFIGFDISSKNELFHFFGSDPASVLLFGDSPIKVSAEFLDACISTLNVRDHTLHVEKSKELAVLGEVFIALSSRVLHMSRHVVPSFLNAFPNTELYVKPLHLSVFLNCAKQRDYRHMRIVLHGGSKQSYDGIRDDFCGVNSKFVGTVNGMAHGFGFYCGLSAHVCASYAKNPNEGFIIGLLMTSEDVNEHHGGYKTFKLVEPNCCDNCIVVRESSLMLILGKIMP